MGWRLGGKGASGRGAAGRIEEHGLHIWLGYYENVFRLVRECYAELKAVAPGGAFSDWRDAFFPDPHIGISEEARDGSWSHWAAQFPPGPGEPGDPVTPNPLTLRNYLVRAAGLLRTLLLGVETIRAPRKGEPCVRDAPDDEAGDGSPDTILSRMAALLRYGVLAGAAATVEALALVETALKSIPFPESPVLRMLDAVAAAIRDQIEMFVATDDDVRRRWEIVDLVLTILVGVTRARLLSNPLGLDAINRYDCREWLRLNGASERTLDSAFLRGLYDLAFAYADGDPGRPRLAAGEALRGGFRMFFGYRGALFWKMRAGMGDVIFAPFYRVLRNRGVKFEYFHRLENVELSRPEEMAPGERPYVTALEFSVQARTRDGSEYEPLIDVKGASCWPSAPDYGQLEDGARIEAEAWDFESHWDRRNVGSRTLMVVRDFDFVVLGVGVGSIPHVCKDFIARDKRWRAMVANVKTVATQAFQIWLREDLQQLGWEAPPVTLSAFVTPFDTWSDMGHLVPAEDWRWPPRTIAYFCSVLEDSPRATGISSDEYRSERSDTVQRNAVAFLERHARHLWPNAVNARGEFRWELLADAAEQDPADDPAQAAPLGKVRFRTQY